MAHLEERQNSLAPSGFVALAPQTSRANTSRKSVEAKRLEQSATLEDLVSGARFRHDGARLPHRVSAERPSSSFRFRNATVLGQIGEGAQERDPPDREEEASKV